MRCCVARARAPCPGNTWARPRFVRSGWWGEGPTSVLTSVFQDTGLSFSLEPPRGGWELWFQAFVTSSVSLGVCVSCWMFSTEPKRPQKSSFFCPPPRPSVRRMGIFSFLQGLKLHFKEKLLLSFWVRMSVITYPDGNAVQYPWSP